MSDNYSKLIAPKPYQNSKMSSQSSRSDTSGRPPPPPPPPPLKSDSPERSRGKRSPSKRGATKHSSLQEWSRRDSGSNSSSGRRHSDPANNTATRSPPSLQSPKKQRSREAMIEKVDSRDLVLENIERNDVPFFDDLDCADSDDEFHFTCCIPPYSPRHPPNPRPQRAWDPSVLPSGTNIPTSIGKPCRRCGNYVYVAEMHLSSRGVYHTECYKCCLCGKTLDSWSVAEYRGEVFCKGCYRRNFSLHGTGFGLGAGVLQTP